MDNRIASLERAVALLGADLAEMRERLARLESGDAAAPAAAADTPSALPELQAAAIQNWVTLAGRTLLVLGGAYLLRALTSAQIVPVPIGVALGLLYGAPWLLLASRAGTRGDSVDAFSHGLATALIGYPLVWEATTRFAVFTPAESAVVLGMLTAAALLLSAMQRLHSLAAIVTCGAIASSLGLGFMTQNWLPYSVLATAVGLGTLWIGYLREWVVLRWPAAFVANGLLFVLPGTPGVSPRAIVAAHLFALVGYLGSFGVRTLLRSRRVLPFEAFQSVGVLAFALGGLIAYVHGDTAAVLTVGITCLIAAAAAYAVTFSFVERRAPAVNLFFYSLLALVLAIVGGALVLGPLASAMFGACALAASIRGRRRVPLVALSQTAIYLVAAGVSSGLLPAATAGLTAPIDVWPGAPAWAWLALAFTAASAALAPSTESSIAARVLRMIVLSLFVWSTIGMAAVAITMALPATAAADAAWLSTIRTIVLVSATFALASVKGDAGRLTYPLLILTGIKLAAMDFPQGRPVTLFLALALYGTALIVAPRVRRRVAVRSSARRTVVSAADSPVRAAPA